jgi:uncharacterized protein (TIGR01777 family)
METVMITGGTGLIGKALSKALLNAGYHVIILTRDHQPLSITGNPEVLPSAEMVPALQYAGWDLRKSEIDHGALAQADYIIHLAGAGIADKRWTKKRKEVIRNSRVKGGELLFNALKNYPNKVKTIVSASAIGWYGPDPVIPNPRPFTEEFPASVDFLGKTCADWEASLKPVEVLGKRVVWLRTGVVFSKDGGAIPKFLLPLKFGIASILGSGRQVLSWIHIDDLVRLYIHALKDTSLSGSYNAVAPFPVSNKTLILHLAKHKKGRFFIPLYVPAFFLKLLYGELSIEVLKSTTVSDRKIKGTGFVFKYPSITGALEKL